MYCRDELHLSEDAAYNRSAAAHAVRRYPVILGWLSDGSLNVTTVKLLGPVLTPENHRAVLTEARHRSKAEVEVIVARVKPKPDVPSSIRKLPVPVAVAGPAVLPLTEHSPSASASASPAAAARPASRRARSPRSVIGCSSQCRRRPTTSSGARRSCSAARSRTATRPPSSTARSTSCCARSRGRSWLPRRSRDRPEERKTAHATSPRMCVASSGSGTEGSVRSWGGPAAAPSGGISSGITSSRTVTRGRRRLRTSPFDAAPTTSTRASLSSAASTRLSSASRPELRCFRGNPTRSGTAGPRLADVVRGSRSIHQRGPLTIG